MDKEESIKDKPNWKKGDVVSLIGPRGCALHIFEAEYDPNLWVVYPIVIDSFDSCGI